MSSGKGDPSPSFQVTPRTWKAPVSPGCVKGGRAERWNFLNSLIELKFAGWKRYGELLCAVFCTDSKFQPS